MVRGAVVVRRLAGLAAALWVLRWAAMELAVRYAPRAEIPPDGPLPGLMPRRFE